MGHVRDVDSNLERAVLVLNDVERVVEVARSLGVDCEDRVLAVVASDLGAVLALGDRVRQLRQALDDSLAELWPGVSRGGSERETHRRSKSCSP